MSHFSNFVKVTGYYHESTYFVDDSTQARAVQLALAHRDDAVTVRFISGTSSETLRPGTHDRVSVKHGPLPNDGEETTQGLADAAAESGVLEVSSDSFDWPLSGDRGDASEPVL